MRLIDADELLLDWEWFDEWGNYTRAGQAVADAPTIDAVEVVRCRDCRFAMVRTKEEMNKPIKPQPILCERLCIGVGNDAYCSRGERREP